MSMNFSDRPHRLHGAFFQHQQGTSLLEALISILLVATLGLGLIMVISNTLRIQSYNITENQILIGLRHLIMTDDTQLILDRSSETTNSGITLTVERTSVPAELVITIDGVSRTINMVNERLTVNDSQHISGDGVIEVSP